MLILRNVKIPYDKVDTLRDEIEKKIGLKNFEYKIYKRSIDARRGVNYVYQVLIDADVDKKILKRLKNDIDYYEEENLEVKNKNNVKTATVVGSGPSGLFVSYILAREGVKVDIIEMGEKVEDRIKSIENFIDRGELKENSNIQFGEGGAGTFSDGKLTSRSKDKRSREIFKILVENGAPEDILYEQMPHVGTDILRKVIINMRKKIESFGGVFHFEEKFIDLELKDGMIKYLITDKNKYVSDEYILALGNSSRDTFIMLDKYITISQKPFAVGFRIEHLREDINFSQYKIKDDRLPAATYQLNHYNEKKDSVYTFCMCPGGFVVPASSEKGRLCVNGMSYHNRNFKNSNSAIVMAIDEKIIGRGNLAGIYFQREIEERAFKLGGGDFSAPVQRLEDFFLNRVTKDFGKVKPSYRPKTKFANLNEIYPELITKTIKESLLNFDKRLNGFADKDAILTGVETRTSSPVRIDRENYHTFEFKNLRPIGEGAGYAGGIISSSLDGLKCAIEILEN